MAANGPVSGSGKPIRIGSLLCARRTAGNASVAAAAVAVVRNSRRCMGISSVGRSGVGRGAALNFSVQIAPIIGAPACPCQSAARLDRARLPRVPQVGAPQARSDDPRLLTGRGRYVDDLVLPPPGPRRLRPQRARPRPDREPRVSTPPRRAPGVVGGAQRGGHAPGSASRTAACSCTTQGMKTGAMLPLAVERVRYVGEPVVAVAAESARRRRGRRRARARGVRAAARRALARGRRGPRRAADPPRAGRQRPLRDAPGRPATPRGRFAGTMRVWRRRSRPAATPACPRAAEPGRRLRAGHARLTVWMSTQVPHMMQAVLAELFGLRRASRARHRARRRRLLRDQDPRLPGRPGGLRAGARRSADP